jgi:hypothetical protein
MFLCAANEDPSWQQTAGKKPAEAARAHPAQVSDGSDRAAITAKIVLMELSASSGLQF